MIGKVIAEVLHQGNLDLLLVLNIESLISVRLYYKHIHKTHVCVQAAVHARDGACIAYNGNDWREILLGAQTPAEVHSKYLLVPFGNSKIRSRCGYSIHPSTNGSKPWWKNVAAGLNVALSITIRGVETLQRLFQKEMHKQSRAASCEMHQLWKI